MSRRACLEFEAVDARNICLADLYYDLVVDFWVSTARCLRSSAACYGMHDVAAFRPSAKHVFVAGAGHKMPCSSNVNYLEVSDKAVW